MNESYLYCVRRMARKILIVFFNYAGYTVRRTMESSQCDQIGTPLLGCPENTKSLKSHAPEG